jgi:hypothetical protein
MKVKTFIFECLILYNLRYGEYFYNTIILLQNENKFNMQINLLNN